MKSRRHTVPSPEKGSVLEGTSPYFREIQVGEQLKFGHIYIYILNTYNPPPPPLETFESMIFPYCSFSLSVGYGLVAIKGKIFQVSWCWQNWIAWQQSRPLRDLRLVSMDLFLIHHTYMFKSTYRDQLGCIWDRVFLAELHMKNSMFHSCSLYSCSLLHKKIPHLRTIVFIARRLAPCPPPSTCAQMELEWLLWTAHQWSFIRTKPWNQVGNMWGPILKKTDSLQNIRSIHTYYIYIYICISYMEVITLWDQNMDIWAQLYRFPFFFGQLLTQKMSPLLTN